MMRALCLCPRGSRSHSLFDDACPDPHSQRMSDPQHRPDWDTYFMDIAHVVATRANCSRRRVAAIIVVDRRVISTGYNGTPRGIRNCYEGGCARCAGDAASGQDLGECVCAHAEENAIVQAAYHGIAVRSGTLYCTNSPCLACTRMIINAGIAEVIFESEYHFSVQARELLKVGGVQCRQYVRTTLTQEVDRG